MFQTQIQNEITTCESEIEKANKLKAEVKTIEQTPSDQTQSELQYLQSVIESLKQALG